MAELPSVAERLRAVVPTVSAGVLAADLMNLGHDLGLLEKAGVKVLHFDVMDGCFCPMMTAGPQLIKSVKTSLLKDVHLMIQDPLSKLESFIAAGADMLTVHIEACAHPHRVFQAIRQIGGESRRPLRGVALNPGTPVGAVEPLLDELEMVFLLAINPGWGGQKFLDSTLMRMEELRRIIKGRGILTGIDGGITKENVSRVANMGADIVVAGSAIFAGSDVVDNARQMMDALVMARKH